jgi:hypothetical protein
MHCLLNQIDHLNDYIFSNKIDIYIELHPITKPATPEMYTTWKLAICYSKLLILKYP